MKSINSTMDHVEPWMILPT